MIHILSSALLLQLLLPNSLVLAFSPKTALLGQHRLHPQQQQKQQKHQHGIRQPSQRNMVVDPMFWLGAVGGDEASAAMMQAAVHHVHELILSSSSSLLLSDAAAAAATADFGTTDVATAASDAMAAASASVSNMGLDFLKSLEAPDVATTAADAAAVVDAAAVNDGGWWQSYLNIFKSTLLLVHETIDPPLRQLGVEHTWGISIAIFTATVRGMLVPLSIQQSKSSEYMKALKPYMNEIKEKFKNNKDMQNRATAKLMEDANQNPLAGCFVSLLQIPVFLGLYRGVRLLAQEGRLNEPFLWIPSLEGPVSPPDFRGLDWLVQGWTQDPGAALPHPQLGWATTLAFLVMPIVLVLGQSVTMKALQPPIDENMSPEEKETMEKSQSLLKFLPLMIGFFSLQVPAGLTIYWFTSNLVTLTQSLAVRSYYKANPPKIELPDYWDAIDGDVADMSPEERRKAAEAGIATGPNFEDLLDEARFHYVVQRPPLRAESVAWQRVQATGVPTVLAATAGKTPELEEWAARDTSSSSSSSSSTSSHNNDDSSSSGTSTTDLPYFVNATAAAASPSA